MISLKELSLTIIFGTSRIKSLMGMPLDPKPSQTVAAKGQRHPQRVTSGDKAKITVPACCNAAGYVLPSYVVYKLNQQYTIGEVRVHFMALVIVVGWMPDLGLSCIFWHMLHCIDLCCC